MAYADDTTTRTLHVAVIGLFYLIEGLLYLIEGLFYLIEGLFYLIEALQRAMYTGLTERYEFRKGKHT